MLGKVQLVVAAHYSLSFTMHILIVL